MMGLLESHVGWNYLRCGRDNAFRATTRDDKVWVRQHTRHENGTMFINDGEIEARLAELRQRREAEAAALRAVTGEEENSDDATPAAPSNPTSDAVCSSSDGAVHAAAASEQPKAEPRRSGREPSAAELAVRLGRVEDTVAKLAKALTVTLEENRALRLEVNVLRDAVKAPREVAEATSTSRLAAAVDDIGTYGERAARRDAVCDVCLTRGQCFRCPYCRSADYCSSACEAAGSATHKAVCDGVRDLLLGL